MEFTTSLAVPWVIPTLLVIHIIAIAGIIGSALVSNLRLAGVLAGDMEVGAVLRRYRPWLWGALTVSLLTGLIMAFARSDRLIGNPVFGAKVALLLAAIVMTLLAPRLHPSTTKPMAWMSMALWVAVIACGHWVAHAGLKGAS